MPLVYIAMYITEQTIAPLLWQKKIYRPAHFPLCFASFRTFSSSQTEIKPSSMAQPGGYAIVDVDEDVCASHTPAVDTPLTSVQPAGDISRQTDNNLEFKSSSFPYGRYQCMLTASIPR